jgi:ATP-dependent Lon protease
MVYILNKFIKNIKFKNEEIKKINIEYNLINKYFLNIIKNLTNLNSLNFFKEYNNHHLHIIKKLDEFKFQLLNIKFKKYYQIIKLKNNLLYICNLICLSTIKKILILYYKLFNIQFYSSSSEINNIFNEDEIKELDFYINFINPICLWDSKICINKNLNNKIIPIKPLNNNVTNEIIIDNSFDINECLLLLKNKNIFIDKNKKSYNFIENRLGCSIYIKLSDRIIVIQGYFNEDIFNLAINNTFAKKKIYNNYINIKNELTFIPESFIDKYYNILNLRDKIIYTDKQLSEEIKKKFNDFKNIQTKPLILLINEFLLGSKYRKIDILTLLLISNDEDSKLGCILFDIFKTKDKKNMATEIYDSLHYNIKQKLDLTKVLIEEDDILKISDNDISYETRINLLKTSQDIKIKAIEKLKSIKNNFQGDQKAQVWLDGLLKIPFNIYNTNEIISFKSNFISRLNNNLYSDYEITEYLNNNSLTELKKEWQQYQYDKRKYLINVRQILDNSVYGLKDAKLQLERIFAQWINGEMKGAVLGLCGPPGTGKTSLIKNGLSKCLKDSNGNPRPFAFLPVGGSVNGSTLVGHNYTYVGSSWGRIIDILMVAKCMNPIIFIDELDKISNTEHGHEIISVLIHLTDSTQNDEFEDKFFAGIKLDLSKALIIFSFNDASSIDYILKDRITIIETHPLNIKEKITIIRDYLLPEILKDIGFSKKEIIIEDNIIEYLINTYTLEAGVRKIKEKIIEIIRDINLKKYFSDDITFPFNITIEFCDKLFENKNKIKNKKILKESMVGVVNGLYASSLGVGGITFIQALKYPSDKKYDLNITGSLGDSMKESVCYSLKIVLNILEKELDNISCTGIHIHCPEAAVKKDGPSAGAAITLAIYSLLTNKKINNKIAITGEIDLLGNITAIGGLETKLIGAKIAGIEMVLIPEENLEDLNIINNNNNLENENFKIILVNNIHDVLKLVFN